MNYVLKLKKNASELNIHSKEINKLYKLLSEDWKYFNKNPLFLVEGLKK
jgi:hypothetical protein